MADNFISSDMIRGHIDTIILLSLVNGDKHTNEIRDEIEARTQGQYQIKQGTFYSCLDRIKKQGFVDEYRSSSDGIRRKYFKLTSKGKDYIENNQNKWTYSKSIINSLIDSNPIKQESKPQIIEIKEEKAPIKKSTTSYTDKNEHQNSYAQDKSQDVFDLFKNHQTDVSNFTVTPTTDKQKTDYFNSLKKQSYQEIASALSKTVKQEEPEEDIFSVIKATPTNGNIEPPKQESNTESYNEIIKKLSKIEENITNYQSSSNSTSSAISEAERQKLFEQPTEETGPKEYREILSKLFPVPNNKQEVSPQVENKPQPAVPQINKEETPKQPAENKIIHKEERFNNKNIEKQYPKQTFSASKQQSKYKPVLRRTPYDFTDLYEMAEQEGFRIKVSTATNREEMGKVLVNKLRFHTSLIHFILAIMQILVLYFSVGTILPYSFGVYGGIIAILAVFPLICGIVYAINPNTRTKDIYSFKTSLELSLIITLNVILIICAFAVLKEVNLRNGIELTKHIIIPGIFALNIPVFFLIKYSLLDKTVYLSK